MMSMGWTDKRGKAISIEKVIFLKYSVYNLFK